jgi:hypothetical protein
MDMEVEIVVPKPHSDIQRQIMNALRTPGVQEVWVACGSKFGKSLAAGGAMAITAPTKAQSIFRWVAPIYTQAQIGMRYVQRLLPGEPYVTANKSTNTLLIPSINTQIQFWHGQHPESLEGEACAGYVLDECSKMYEQVYSSAKTTTQVTRGPLLAISTPRGKNWFFKKCIAAMEEMQRAKFEGRTPRQIFLTAPTTANPYVPKESIIEMRENLPDRLYRQYVLAEFVEDSDTFTGYRDVVEGPLLEYNPSQRQTYFGPSCKEATVVIGADWAKKSDFTVFTAWELGPMPRMIAFDRFNGAHVGDYVGAVKELMRFASNFKHVSIIYHDRTGVGEVIEDLLNKTNLPFEGIIFTNNSKSFMVNQFMVAIQRRALRLPNWSMMCQELDSYEVTTTDIGNMKYSAPSGMHDDIISSMFLGWSAVAEFTSHTFEVKILEELPSSPSGTIEKWYNDLQDDDLDDEPGLFT